MSTTAHRLGRARRLTVLIPVLAAITASGCATHAPTPPPASAPASGAAFPVQLSPAGAPPVVLDHRPERIISLSATSTETLFAIDAGKQVVAVDDQSSFPAQAPKTTLSGLTPNLEAIAGYHPDLVIAQGDANDMVAGLSRLNPPVPVLLLRAATTLDDVYGQFLLLGKATGHNAEAEQLAGRTRDEIGRIVAAVPVRNPPLHYYHELTTELYSATSDTFVGRVYGLFGLTSIADPAGPGYPQLSAERVLSADPDLIFLADTHCCGQTAATVAARPGWGTIKAVRGGHVVPLDDDLASRWGPRIVDLVRAVADAVRAV